MSRKNKHQVEDAVGDEGPLPVDENPVMRLEGEEAVSFAEAIVDDQDAPEGHCPLCREPLEPGPREQVVIAWRDRAAKAHIDCAQGKS